MKKTLITLMALGGVAWAGVDGDWTATFTTTDQSYNQTWEDYAAAFETDAPLTLNFTGLTITGTNKNGAYTAGDMYPTTIRPNANVCAQNSDSYVLTFTVENTSNERLDITTITLATFGYNSAGGAHENDNGPAAVYELSYKMDDGTEFVSLGNPTAAIFREAEVAYNIAGNGLTLNAGDTVNFSLNISKSGGSGSFVGLSGATFSVIPEPATATLSLLALCGLAARRRRH